MLLQKPLASLSVLFLRRKTIQYCFCSTIAENHYEEVARREFIIKPSSSTPHHLATYKLSILDQTSPPQHMPILLFYPHNDAQVSVDEKHAVLKASLSKTLTRFYPLAGRIHNQTTVDCNDDGALYTEVKLPTQMIDFLQPPKFEWLHKLLPRQLISKEPDLNKSVQVNVQANVFSCGGIALGITMLHRLVDGATFSTFLKAWAEIARGNLDQELHNLDNIAASLFPANELSSIKQPIEAILAEVGKRRLMKRFVFNSNAISVLREKATSEQVPNPTRTEVISGLLWKHAMNAYQVKTGNERPSWMANTVNIRHRLNPKQPHDAFGNIYWVTIANYDPTTLDTNMDLPYLVSLLRKSIDQVNPAFLNKLQGEEGAAQILKTLEERKESLRSTSSRPIVYGVTSTSKMGLYQVDFGWGKPTWISIGPSTETYLSNIIFQTETRNGDGIEASFVLDPEEMEILEHDQDFLKYATKNPDVKP